MANATNLLVFTNFAHIAKGNGQGQAANPQEMSLEQAQQAPGSLCYLKPSSTYKTEKPYFVRFPIDNIPEATQTNLAFDYYKVDISDIRGADVDLDTHGFQLAPFHSRFSYDDFANFDKIQSEYFGEVAGFLKQQLGVSFVNVYDCTIRRRTPTFPEAQFQKKDIQPIRAVHIDSARHVRIQRALDALKAANITAKGRVIMLGIWRPIRGPVRDWPLAVCDYRTCSPDDIVDVDQVYPDHVGEGSNLLFNPNHRWYFVSNQMPNEALMMKMLDSDPNASDYCAHAAFPYEVKDTEMRESVEVRVVCFKPDDGMVESGPPGLLIRG
jgi:hypothetical protein